MVFDDLTEPHRLRSSIGNCKHVHPKRIFQTRLLIEHVFQVFNIRIFFQFENNTDSFFGRLIRDVYDIICLLCLHQCTDIVQKLSDPCADHRIRNLRDDQTFLSAFSILYLYFSAKFDLSCTGLIDGWQIIFVDYDAPGREIRPLQICQKFFRCDLIIPHVCLYCIDHLTQVMCRDTRGHTDCDSLRTIDKEVRNSDRKHFRLFFCLVKIWHKIYNVFIKICQIRFLRDLGQTALRITHRRSAVPFYRPKIPVTVYQHHSLFKILRHNNQRLIDGTVTVWVIFTHRISDDTGTLSVWSVISDPKFIHIIERSSLYRL